VPRGVCSPSRVADRPILGLQVGTTADVLEVIVAHPRDRARAGVQIDPGAGARLSAGYRNSN
jgi:hypothetical protein